MAARRFVTLCFNDGTNLKLSFPKQGGKDAATLSPEALPSGIIVGAQIVR
jgi:hypothetical protein